MSPPTSGRVTARSTAPQVGTSRQLVSLWYGSQPSASCLASSFLYLSLASVAEILWMAGTLSAYGLAGARVGVERAELARERRVLVLVEVLVAEEDDLVL